jgi:hypothetical protein
VIPGTYATDCFLQPLLFNLFVVRVFQVCVQIVADLLAMEAMSPGEEIKIYLNSPESVPYYIVAIIDVIKQVLFLLGPLVHFL